MPPDDEVYTEWLAAAPKGVRWDRAQEMWEEYQRKRREQAQAVAARLLGKVRIPWCDKCQCHHFESAGHDPDAS